jgi:YVTN family beta-propeller protein
MLAKALTCASLAVALASGAKLQNSGLDLVQTITVPNWSVGVANTDLFGFNPVTRVMYLADRTNHAVTVIDTHTNTVIGKIPLALDTVVNQPLIAIDLQQLVVSDGKQSVLVWNLITPTPNAQPDVYLMPATTPDGMDYDSINQTVYVVTDDKPYTLVGISLAQKAIVSQTPIPFSADLIRFNAVDGKIYIAMEDADNNNASAGIGVFDPVTGEITTPSMYRVGSICPGHGIDIDPVSNVAVMGCFGGTSNGNLAINLNSGKVVAFPDVGGTDSIVLNPNLRRFYSGSGLNTATTSGCPSTPNTPPFGSLVPVVGVFDAIHPTPSFPARLDGVACSGRGNHIAGVDPIRNNVLVPVAQFPADPGSATTGTAGILVFHDKTAAAQPPVNSATVGLGTFGTVRFAVDESRRMHVAAHLSGITGPASLTIPTTVWNEVVHCSLNTTNNSASCDDFLLGNPLIGGTVTLSVSQTPAARGIVAACHGDKEEENDGHSCGGNGKWDH